MKKSMIITLITIAVLLNLTACGSNMENNVRASEQLSIVTTIYPEYDWVREVLGENPSEAEITMLMDSSVDLHSYQPVVDDIIKISSCDLFIYVGGESDAWVEDALKEATNEDMIVINLLDVLGDAVKEEELVEGMEAGEGHDEVDEGHDEGHDEVNEDHDEGHDEVYEEAHEAGHEEPEYDEHVWLSLRNAQILCQAIADALAELDADNAEVYQENVTNYKEKLSALDAEYEKAVSEANHTTLLFGDRFPFRYLADDYGLDYYAAFSGCSAETEASFETITFLAAKVDELELDTVITIEGTEHKIAETIIQNTQEKNQQILILDSMQAASLQDAENGITYLSIMEQNLEVLKEALQ